MAILKEVSAEEESLRATFREMQKQRMSEVLEIREAIVELFDGNSGKGFTNQEILEWLISKGFNVNARQVPAKMNMLRNVFYEERVEGKVKWLRRVCDVCKRPLELGDELWLWDKVNGIQAFCGKSNLEGHHACFESVSELLKPYKNKIDELNGQVSSLFLLKGTLLEENAALQEEVNRLKSMIVFPSENQVTGRRIEL